MIAHPDEAGDIVAKPFNITPEVARSAVRNLTTSLTQGVPYWGDGRFHLSGMKRIIEVQKSVGALTGDNEHASQGSLPDQRDQRGGLREPGRPLNVTDRYREGAFARAREKRAARIEDARGVVYFDRGA